MYSVLIVDDEMRALSGIERTFPWAAYGFEVVFTTTDSLEALGYLESHEIDLALVDIRMPELSGLELIERSQRAGSRTVFVIVSGYSEFEFAREALRKGVFDYCLKPIDAAAAEAILGRAMEYLAKRRDPVLPAVPAASWDRDALAPLFFDGRRRCHAVVCRYSTNDIVDRLPTFAPGTTAFHEANLGEERVFLVESGPQHHTVPVTAAGGGCLVGIGPLCDDVDGALISLERAREALRAGSYYPGERVFVRTPLLQQEVERLVGELRGALLSGSAFVVGEFFDELPGRCRSLRFMPWDLEALLAGFAAVVRCPEIEQGVSLSAELEREADPYAGRNTFEVFVESLRRLVLSGVDPATFRAICSAQADDRIQRLIEYIHLHLSDGLTLKDLSGRFNFHPNYGSELFKRVTGMRFSEYVINLKIWKAKGLLTGTGDTIASIAETVGYDYFHFSKLFKQCTGLTPREYRLRAKAVGESGH
jgi:two-component system, response regulator YesN